MMIYINGIVLGWVLHFFFRELWDYIERKHTREEPDEHDRS